ncbi:MAG: hypothetical protein J7M40_00860 [Planctomycetes bacterium]|nr:hypothetical protein [Planctomycetota bacterium]
MRHSERMVNNATSGQPNRIFSKITVSVVVFSVICFLASRLSGPGQQGRWCSIVPPVLAIFLAFLTRRVILSLGVAFVVGSLLIQVPEAPLVVGSWFDGFQTAGVLAVGTITDPGNLKILAFIPPVFVMIELIIASGGFNGVILWLLKWVKGKKTAQAQTAILGILCFIDDYANAIIVGSMMQPITDRFGISREKLAFIVDATSAPISGLAVVSTWIAMEVGLFASVSTDLGFGRSGYSMFFDALAFRFYCFFMIMFVFVNIFSGRDFGPMKKAQDSAVNPNEDGGKFSLKVKGRAANALVPLGGFLLFHFTGLWFDGGGRAKLLDGRSFVSWSYWQDVIGNSHNSTVVLAFAALFGLILALLCGLISRSLQSRAIVRCFWNGLKRTLLPSCILLLAWSLKGCCDALETGAFLTELLAGRVSPFAYPAILFLVASITSFATGTSWGTMAILIPTAIPIAFALDGETYGLTTMISLGAVLDGAIFGDHCSPISDTTIISSMSSNCNLMQHVRTQLPYSLFVAVVAIACGYIPAVFGLAWIWSVLLAATVTIAAFAVPAMMKQPATPADDLRD